MPFLTDFLGRWNQIYLALVTRKTYIYLSLPGLKVSVLALFLAHTLTKSCTFYSLFFHSVHDQNMATEL